MPEQKAVFLNGAAFWYPLVSSGFALTSLGMRPMEDVIHVPLAITGGMLIINLLMLLSCRSAFGRWLGRTKCNDIGLALSCFVSMIIAVSPAFGIETNFISFPAFFILIFAMFTLSFAFVTLLTESFYVENTQGQMTYQLNTDGYNWKSLLKKRTIRSGYKLMQRKLFGPSLVRAAEGMEWLAWRIEDIGNQYASVVVFGDNMASARKSAAQLLNVEPELIVIVAKEMESACSTELTKAAEQAEQTKNAQQRADSKEEERRRQEKKAKVIELQNQICPENSPLLLENHTNRMDRLFSQAIGLNHDPVSVDKR
jgi:hypothetical protein